jgi:hypothetical protein
MTPTAIFQKLLNTNRAAAVFILGGLALLAAATIAVTWIGKNPAALLLAAYILGFAFLVTMATYIVHNTQTRAVIGWVLTGLIVIFLAGLVESAISLTGRLPTPACYVRILWEHPKSCEQRLFPAIPVASTTPSRMWHVETGGPERLWFAQHTTATPRANPYTTGPIYLQFGGRLDRDTAIAIAAQLGALGWPVAGGDQGGELLTDLPGTNEVRFFDPAAAEDAVALALTIKATRPEADIAVRDFSKSGLIAPPGLLEIWLGN